ncbi:MAG: CHASE2 domain-containing protein [Synechococcales bacterium]|nr:CHASE2 domain-containing protein [Synechococcales bacterium]
MQFNLYLQSHGSTCYFRLTWGQGQSIAAEVSYPTDVFQRYEVWQKVYLQYYRSFRVKTIVSGSAPLPLTDWRSPLIEQNQAFLDAFQNWLAQAKLMPIRVELVKALRLGSTDLFITCETPEFDRLPWEAWAESPEFAGTLRIARLPTIIRSPAGAKRLRSKLRILAILGDETGLNFAAEREALKGLRRDATVEFVGWQGKSDQGLRSQIRAAMTDEQGWDVLIFAGHSNETALTGGELGIAPGESLMLSEITQDLQAAIDRGLQFAIFNSCKGLSIAQTLIDIGLSQVIIMREPIHNRVAQCFLLDFLKQFMLGLDVDEALRSATQALANDPNLDYPASQWVPSLFRHPAAPLFQCLPIERFQWLKQWKPDRWEACVIGSAALLSLYDPIQLANPVPNALMNLRQGVQTLYRVATHQVPQDEPRIQLVTIDQPSLDQAGILRRQPMDWNYLAQVLDRVSEYQPKIVGVDFLLDRPEDHPPAHVKTLQRSLQRFANQPLVLSSIFEEGQEVKVSSDLVSQAVISGYTNTADWYMPITRVGDACVVSCPFAMRMANFSSPLIREVHPVTHAARNVGQFWLHPIQDFSIPTDRVYRQISAKDLGKLDRSVLQNQVVVVVANYAEAGLEGYHKDYTSDVPLPIQWGTPPDRKSPTVFTGGERLAYSIHHFMTRHFVVAIPDLWMVFVAGLVAKLLQIRFPVRSRRQKLWIGLGIVGYGIVGLQLYLSAKLLLPFFLPAITLGLLVFPRFRKMKS